MGYLDKRLNQNEVIRYRVHVSWIPMILRFFAFFIPVSALAGVLWGINQNILFVLAVYLAYIILYALANIGLILKLIGTEIVLTNKRLRSKEGIITVKNDREATFDRIDRIDIDMNSILERIFDYGNIEFQTVGSNGYFIFKKIAHPYEVKEAFNNCKQEFYSDTQSRSIGYSQRPAI